MVIVTQLCYGISDYIRWSYTTRAAKLHRIVEMACDKKQLRSVSLAKVIMAFFIHPQHSFAERLWAVLSTDRVQNCQRVNTLVGLRISKFPSVRKIINCLCDLSTIRTRYPIRVTCIQVMHCKRVPYLGLIVINHLSTCKCIVIVIWQELCFCFAHAHWTCADTSTCWTNQIVGSNWRPCRSERCHNVDYKGCVVVLLHRSSCTRIKCPRFWYVSWLYNVQKHAININN